jgi:hypothetical protein
MCVLCDCTARYVSCEYVLSCSYFAGKIPGEKNYLGDVALLEEKHQEKLSILPFWQSKTYLGLLNR